MLSKLKRKKVFLVSGARPNFMKVAPLFRAFRSNPCFVPVLVHTGQHYDHALSTTVWNDLGLPKPDVFLGVGSGTHAEQTAAVMIKFERVCLQEKPDLVIVVGDVNSTMACAIVAKKLAISVAHVEAGLRSSDMGMPEEINRILTDSISDYLFVSEKSGYSNLIKEGKSRKKIHFVGNIMIDSLLSSSRRISKSKILSQLKLFPKQYGLVTLHRPSNVDSFSQLGPLLRELNLAAKLLPLVFPVHPRTRKNIQNLRGCDISTDIALIDPVGYIDFLCLVSNASYVLTDSGGIQEETTFLGVPCLTLRENTERPITIEIGTNKLVSTRSLRGELKVVLSGKWKRGKIPKYWDGNTAHRIISVLSPKS